MTRRTLARAAPAAIVAVLVTGCGTPAGGDPGGRRLHELAADRVFAATPPGARSVVVSRVPAVRRHPAFQSSGWDGPAVLVSFADSAPPAEVYGFYARRAAAAGWRPTAARNGLGFADVWTKTYPDGAAATLILGLRSHLQPASQRRYRLAGSTSTV